MDELSSPFPEDGGFEGNVVGGESSCLKTKNLVVFPLTSSIPSARIGILFNSAAIPLEMAAEDPLGSAATSSAPRLVELTSILSIPGKFVSRNWEHWVQAWGWEYSFLILVKSLGSEEEEGM